MTQQKKYQTVLKRYNYYARWYRELPMIDKFTTLGQWVKERAEIYHSILLGYEKEQPLNTLAKTA